MVRLYSFKLRKFYVWCIYVLIKQDENRFSKHALVVQKHLLVIYLLLLLLQFTGGSKLKIKRQKQNVPLKANKRALLLTLKRKALEHLKRSCPNGRPLTRGPHHPPPRGHIWLGVCTWDAT